MICCEWIRELYSRDHLTEHFTCVKEYDPQPKNEDGSIRRFLYRWDDGKNGVRRLMKCRHCGRFFLVQAYHLHKFSTYADVSYEDWYAVGSEAEADQVNESYTGLQWELQHIPVLRCADDEIVICGG